MGLLDKLETEGSKFTYTADGAVATPYPQDYLIAVNQLATGQSTLHATGDVEGYSLNGANVAITTALYNQYKDGVINTLPNPSELDLNGQFPSYGKYEDNAPEGALGI
jgi:hypothetical protein